MKLWWITSRSAIALIRDHVNATLSLDTNELFTIFARKHQNIQIRYRSKPEHKMMSQTEQFFISILTVNRMTIGPWLFANLFILSVFHTCGWTAARQCNEYFVTFRSDIYRNSFYLRFRKRNSFLAFLAVVSNSRNVNSFRKSFKVAYISFVAREKAVSCAIILCTWGKHGRIWHTNYCRTNATDRHLVVGISNA